MALLVKTSECHKERHSYVFSVSSNIPALSDSCLMLAYDFIAVTGPSGDIKNYHEFIYKGNMNLPLLY